MKNTIKNGLLIHNMTDPSQRIHDVHWVVLHHSWCLIW